MRLNTTDAQGTYGGGKWDSNVGFGAESYWSSTSVAWMWKRHAGFDVVAYEGNAENSRIIRHSLGAVPEMIWVKNRDDTTNWIVGNHGLDGGTDPWTHYLYLNTTAAEGDYDFFVDKAPTAYSFEVTTGSLNDTNKSYVALLFKSVAGISKVGSYTGTGSSQDISLDFTPRFLIIKRTDGTGNWVVYDTTRGWSSSSNKVLLLNSSDSEYTFTGTDIYAEPGLSNGDTKGFRPVNAHGDSNTNTSTYVYYAHA